MLTKVKSVLIMFGTSSAFLLLCSTQILMNLYALYWSDSYFSICIFERSLPLWRKMFTWENCDLNHIKNISCHLDSEPCQMNELSSLMGFSSHLYCFHGCCPCPHLPFGFLVFTNIINVTSLCRVISHQHQLLDPTQGKYLSPAQVRRTTITMP